MSCISEIREVNKPQPPPGILLSTVPLYNRDETKCVIILLKKLLLCSLEFSIELSYIITYSSTAGLRTDKLTTGLILDSRRVLCKSLLLREYKI